MLFWASPRSPCSGRRRRDAHVRPRSVGRVVIPAGDQHPPSDADVRSNGNGRARAKRRRCLPRCSRRRRSPASGCRVLRISGANSRSSSRCGVLTVDHGGGGGCIVISAIYGLRAVARVFFGRLRPHSRTSPCPSPSDLPVERKAAGPHPARDAAAGRLLAPLALGPHQPDASNHPFPQRICARPGDCRPVIRPCLLLSHCPPFRKSPPPTSGRRSCRSCSWPASRSWCSGLNSWCPRLIGR